MKENKYLKTFINGLLTENPVLVLLLGMCPTLAVSTSVNNAIGMGLATTFVLTCSNVVISLLRKIIPGEIRIASFVVIIAGFVTIVQMLLSAFLPELNKSLGVFIPLIVVNCIILGRAEAFASKNGVLSSAIDGLGMGAGFTIALTVIATIRELLANGSFYGISLLGENFAGANVMIMAPGGFLTLGIIIAILGVIRKRREGGDSE